MATTSRKPPAEKRPRVLIVDDEPAIAELVEDGLGRDLNLQLLRASNLDEARSILARQDVSVLVTDVLLPDGNGLSLLPQLHRQQPAASALVITGAANLDVAVDALRNGAVDFMAKPFTAAQLGEHLRAALAAQDARRREENRHHKLRAAFKRLHAARRIVSRKVDLLCNDLIGAYGDLSRRFDGVRQQQSYRHFIEQARGLEQLLCHTMDWLLRQLGYCNIGIWLAAEEQDLQLGAYMKYTMAAEPELMDAMSQNLLRMVIRRGFIRLRQPDANSQLTAAELKYLGAQDILAVNCTYLGETLGVMAMFRDHATPFSESDVAAVKSISPLFALALARAVRAHDAGGDDAKPRPKKDPADWWKNGEEPPF